MTDDDLIELLRDDTNTIGADPETVAVEREAKIARAVDRAVHEPLPKPLKLPASVAVEQGWCVCTECGYGIFPGRQVRRADADFHPECAAELLRAAA